MLILVYHGWKKVCCAAQVCLFWQSLYAHRYKTHLYISHSWLVLIISSLFQDSVDKELCEQVAINLETTIVECCLYEQSKALEVQYTHVLSRSGQQYCNVPYSIISDRVLVAMGVWANIKLTWFVVSGVVYHTCALSFYRYRCFVSIGWYPRIHLGHRTLPRRLLVFWHPVQVIQFRRKNKQSILIRILHDYFKIISP